MAVVEKNKTLNLDVFQSSNFYCLTVVLAFVFVFYCIFVTTFQGQTTKDQFESDNQIDSSCMLFL